MPSKNLSYITMNIHLSFLLLGSLLIISILSDPIEAAKRDKKVPIVLDEQSWVKLLEGEWMFDLYAPWCPACKRLEPEWEKFAQWADDLNINVASADVTANPALSGRFMVRGLPTIYHVKDGVFRIYDGPRQHTSLITFVEEQNWKSIEPVSRFLAPNTLQMSFLAYSFRLSMTLRDIHNHLVDNVGLPYYVSYSIFALCTVIIGTTLGLLIVFFIDLLCPARHNEQPQESRKGASAARKREAKGSDLEDTTESEGKRSPSKGGVRRRVKNDKN